MKMKLIFLDGGPASGKSTLGELLVDKFNSDGEKTQLLDLDTFVEKYCPTWIWVDENQKLIDLQNARKDFLEAINLHLFQGNNVVAIGEKLLSKDDLSKYTTAIGYECTTYLFHLQAPLEIRRKRLHDRGPHSLIDIDKDQKERDLVTHWPGVIYENLASPFNDAKNIYELILHGAAIM